MSLKGELVSLLSTNFMDDKDGKEKNNFRMMRSKNYYHFNSRSLQVEIHLNRLRNGLKYNW